MSRKPSPVHKSSDTAPEQVAFAEVLEMIRDARGRAFQAVNTELVGLYWQVGEYISRKLASAEWGDGVIDKLARYLAETQPGLRGFMRRNLFRMRQFYETYAADEKVSPLVTLLPWTRTTSTKPPRRPRHESVSNPWRNGLLSNPRRRHPNGRPPRERESLA